METQEKNFLTTGQFTETILAEIEELAVIKPYHGFQLIASFNEFARLELGINIFNNPIVDKGLNYMTNHYKPIGLWLINEESETEKHLEINNGRICLDITKTIQQIRDALAGITINENKYLEI